MTERGSKVVRYATVVIGPVLWLVVEFVQGLVSDLYMLARMHFAFGFSKSVSILAVCNLFVLTFLSCVWLFRMSRK